MKRELSEVLPTKKLFSRVLTVDASITPGAPCLAVNEPSLVINVSGNTG